MECMSERSTVIFIIIVTKREMVHMSLSRALPSYPANIHSFPSNTAAPWADRGTGVLLTSHIQIFTMLYNSQFFGVYWQQLLLSTEIIRYFWEQGMFGEHIEGSFMGTWSCKLSPWVWLGWQPSHVENPGQINLWNYNKGRGWNHAVYLISLTLGCIKTD